VSKLCETQELVLAVNSKDEPSIRKRKEEALLIEKAFLERGNVASQSSRAWAPNRRTKKDLTSQDGKVTSFTYCRLGKESRGWSPGSSTAKEPASRRWIANSPGEGRKGLFSDQAIVSEGGSRLGTTAAEGNRTGKKRDNPQAESSYCGREGRRLIRTQRNAGIGQTKGKEAGPRKDWGRLNKGGPRHVKKEREPGLLQNSQGHQGPRGMQKGKKE